jgi:hypothetical protein
MSTKGSGVLTVLQTFQVGVGLLLGHVAAFDRRIEVCSGVPDSDVSGSVVELV